MKRRRISDNDDGDGNAEDGCALFDLLPDEMLQAICRFDSTEMMRSVCTRFHEAVLAVPPRVCIGSGRDYGLAYLYLLPPDAYPYKVEINITDRNIDHLARFLLPSSRPRIRRAVVVGVYSEMKLTAKAAESVRDIIAALVNLNDVEVLCVDAEWSVIDLVDPRACRLRKLYLARGTSVVLDHPVVRIPVEIDISRWFEDCRVSVSSTTFNPALRVLKTSNCDIIVDDAPLAGSQAAQKTFASWYKCIQVIRQEKYGEFVAPRIHDFENPCGVIRALVRGMPAEQYQRSPTWELAEMRAAPRGVSFRKVMGNDYLAALGLRLKPWSVIACGAPLDANDGSVCDALRTRVPPSPRISLADWTRARVATILEQDGSLFEHAHELLRGDFESALTGPLVTQYIIDEAVEILYGHSRTKFAIALLRLLPPGILSREDIGIIETVEAHPADDSMPIGSKMGAKALLQWEKRPDIRDEWLASAERYYASLDCV